LPQTAPIVHATSEELVILESQPRGDTVEPPFCGVSYPSYFEAKCWK
jgi:hypothetical protein